MSSEGPAEAPQAGQPFDAAPRALSVPRQGCSRMALAGCAALLLLIGLGVLTLMLKAREVVGWSLERVRVEIERTLPDELPAEDRERLGKAFDGVFERLEEGELDAVTFSDLQSQLLYFAGLGREPTREEVADLAAALERFAGLERGGAGEGSAPLPGDPDPGSSGNDAPADGDPGEEAPIEQTSEPHGPDTA